MGAEAAMALSKEETVCMRGSYILIRWSKQLLVHTLAQRWGTSCEAMLPASLHVHWSDKINHNHNQFCSNSYLHMILQKQSQDCLHCIQPA